MREALRLEEALHVDRARRQTRERSFRPRSTSITCSARSFSEARSFSASPGAAGRRAGDRVHARAALLDLDERLRRGADEREAVELEQEEVRRGVDAAQRAVQVERRGRGSRRSARCERTIWNASPSRMYCFARSTPRTYSNRPGKRASVRCARCARLRGGSAARPAAPRPRPGRPGAPRPARATWSNLTRVSATTKLALGKIGPGCPGAERSARAAPRGRSRGSRRPARRAPPPPRTRRSASRARRTSGVRAARARRTRAGTTRPPRGAAGGTPRAE